MIYDVQYLFRSPWAICIVFGEISVQVFWPLRMELFILFSELWEFKLNNKYLKGETFDVVFLTETSTASCT